MGKDEGQTLCDQLLVLPEQIQEQMNKLAALVNAIRILDNDMSTVQSKHVILVAEAMHTTGETVTPKDGKPAYKKMIKTFPNAELRAAEVAKRLQDDIHYRTLITERDGKDQAKTEAESELKRFTYRFRAIEAVLTFMGIRAQMGG